MKKSKMTAALLLASIAGLGGGVAMQTQSISPTTEARVSQINHQDQRQSQTNAATQEAVAFVDWWRRNRRTRREGFTGPGWTNRHVQRMARKKRNQARHRKACRG